MMLEAISRILDQCSSTNSVLPPTELFNEGWMLRLLLDWFDRYRSFNHPLAFAPGARWYSEALLPSKFLATFMGDLKAESYTHADGIIGHFTVASGKKGDAVLLSGAEQFIVIEAKIVSSLSAGTKHAPTYDQAARTVACMARMLEKANVNPGSLDQLAFYVLAPDAQIKAGIFADLVTHLSIKGKVQDRVRPYGGIHDAWFNDLFLPTLQRIVIGVLSWENILNALPETEETAALEDFYSNCLQFNPLKSKKSG